MPITAVYCPGGVNMDKTIGFIGVGSMGGAIVSGMVESGYDLQRIALCGHTIPEKFLNLNINVTNLTNLVEKSDYIILCIKPNGFEKLLNEIKSIGGYGEKIFVSVAAGIKISYVRGILGNVKVIRTMPNLPLMCGEGMTAMCRTEEITDTDFKTAERIFSCSGKCTEVGENLIDACTAVSGSGPAYAFMFIEAMADAAVKHGIKREDAYLLASQTLLGSARMQLETGLHPAALKDMVCSPGGTTVAAVAALEEKGFRSAVISAVDACAQRADEMGKPRK